MPNTYTSIDLFAGDSADFTIGDPMPDRVRCFGPRADGTGGGNEIQLPQVAGDVGDGARVTIRNFSKSRDVQVNPFSAEVIEGRTGTMRIRPGQTVTLQGGPVSTLANQGVFGWEVVSLGLQPAAV